MTDTHATLKDERVARLAAQKKVADLEVSLARTSESEGDLKSKLALSESSVQQRESENANLTAALRIADAKLATMSNKLQGLAKASQETTQRLRSELERMNAEKRKVVVARSMETVDGDHMRKQLAEQKQMN